MNRALWCQALADQACMIVSIDWRTTATTLPVFYKHMLPKNRKKEYWKSNAISITAIMSSMLRRSLYPLFSYCFMLNRLEVMSQCCNNFFTYLSIYISTVKHPKQNKWFNKWWKQSSMLPSTKTLLYDAFACAFGLRCSFFRLLSKTTYSFAFTTSRIVTEVL